MGDTLNMFRSERIEPRAQERCPRLRQRVIVPFDKPALREDLVDHYHQFVLRLTRPHYHHCNILEIGNNSFRFKQRQKRPKRA